MIAQITDRISGPSGRCGGQHHPGPVDIKRRKAQLLAQMENLRQGLRVAKAMLDKAKQDARSTLAESAQPGNPPPAVEEYQEVYDEAVKQLPLTENGS